MTTISAPDDLPPRQPHAPPPVPPAGQPAGDLMWTDLPRRLPPPDPADPADPAAPAQVRLASAEALLAVVPNLLGFHPSQSLVVLGVSEPRDRVSLTFRYDLPGPADGDLAADIASHAREVLTRHEIPAAIVIGYGSAALVSRAAGPVITELLSAGLEVRGALRAEGGRYWSLTCPEPDCCPAEGVWFDPCSHPAAAALNEAGLGAFPDRAALARSLEPPPGTARQTRLATSRALRRLGRLAEAAEQAGRDPAAEVARAGCATVRDAIRRYQAGASITDRGRLAFLAVAVSMLQVRDDAWARMEPARHRVHQRLWTDVVTAAAPEHVPAPAALLAFTAWQAGEGALANVAVARALASDPDYTMALLIGEAVQAGFPPAAARLPMTPEEVADSYATGRAANPAADPAAGPAAGPAAPAAAPPKTP
jgi:hypothetical protein